MAFSTTQGKRREDFKTDIPRMSSFVFQMSKRKKENILNVYQSSPKAIILFCVPSNKSLNNKISTKSMEWVQLCHSFLIPEKKSLS